jgi:hypothetical protein
MPDVVKEELKNLRDKNPTQNDAVQYGRSRCQADYLTYLGLKNTYNGQTVYDTTKHYQPIANNISNDVICLHRENGTGYGLPRYWEGLYFDLNVWNMNFTYQNISVCNDTTIYNTVSTDHSNFTTWKTVEYCNENWNLTNNLFLWRPK